MAARGRALAVAALAVAIVLPFVLSSFRAFQFTQVFIYAIALLGLNILIGFNGQFSLGHSAFYWAVLFGAAVVSFLMWRFVRSPFGLTLRAARDHPRRAEAIGVNIRRHHWVAFVIAGFFGGLAGSAFTFLKGSVFPDYLSVAMSVEPLVMVLLGGVASPSGPLIGAAVYKVLDTVITRYTDYWQFVLGGILILLVLAFPRGIAGALRPRRP